MSRKNTLAFTAGMAVAALIALTQGCQKVNTRNDPAFVEAMDRYVNETVGPEYVDYVNADPNLTELQRQSRIGNHEAGQDAVNQARIETAQTGG